MIEDLINTIIILGFVFGGFFMGYWYRGYRDKDKHQGNEQWSHEF